jgi:SSS family solute:Na+ symporter
MVSGLLVPLIAGLFFKAAYAPSAIAAMLVEGLTTVILTLWELPLPLGLDPNIFGITFATIIYIVI